MTAALALPVDIKKSEIPILIRQEGHTGLRALKERFEEIAKQIARQIKAGQVFLQPAGRHQPATLRRCNACWYGNSAARRRGQREAKRMFGMGQRQLHFSDGEMGCKFGVRGKVADQFNGFWRSNRDGGRKRNALDDRIIKRWKIE